MTPANRTLRIAPFILVLIMPCSSVWAQQKMEAPGTLGTRSVVAAALGRLKAAETDHARFTYFRREHLVNSSIDTTSTERDKTFEVTWINDHEYDRLAQVRGKPLKGAELKAEQQLYDDAIANRQTLGGRERANLDGITSTIKFPNVSEVLEPAYVLNELNRPKSSPHGDLRVIVATLSPRTLVTSNCRWRFTIWISNSPPTLFYYRIDAPHDYSDPCRGDSDERFFDDIDGYTLPVHHIYVAYVPYRPDRVRVHDDITYTNYRRFTTSVTLEPVLATPREAVAPAPAGPPTSTPKPNR